jgi:hypothetical protein
VLIKKFQDNLKRIYDWIKAGAPSPDEQLGYHNANRADFQREISHDIDSTVDSALYEEQESIQKKLDRFLKEVSRIRRDQHANELRLNGYTELSVIRQ